MFHTLFMYVYIPTMFRSSKYAKKKTNSSCKHTIILASGLILLFICLCLIVA
uniref:Uncharacterized protein n=1 Tax=viral metagenome TaxID=1070528 RepID=A0A6C0KLA9_9ZZZZ